MTRASPAAPPTPTAPSSPAPRARAGTTCRSARRDSVAGGADAGGDLGIALLLEAPEVGAAAVAEVLDEAVERLIEEELRARAALRDAVGHARDAHVGRARGGVDAFARAPEHLEAPHRGAVAAVLVAVGARLVRPLALLVAAHRAHAAVVRARRARLGALAQPVAAALAGAAVVGAGEARLARPLARLVAARRALAAVGRAAEARLAVLAEAVAARLAGSAVLRAAVAELAGRTGAVAAAGALAAVERAVGAALAGLARAVAAGGR